MSYVPEQTVLELVEPDSAMGTRVLWNYMTEIVGRYHGRAVTEAEVAESIRGNPSDDLREPQGLLLAARQRDTPMGCGGLRRLGDHIAELTRVYVGEPLLREDARVIIGSGYWADAHSDEPSAPWRSPGRGGAHQSATERTAMRPAANAAIAVITAPRP